MNRLQSKASLEADFTSTLSHLGPYTHKTAAAYANARFERPSAHSHGINPAELARLRSLPRPPQGVVLLIEIDDVLRGSTDAVLSGLGMGIKAEELESRFLFQCEGFGTPSETQAKLQTLPYSPVKSLPHALYALNAISSMGYTIYLTTPTPDDPKGIARGWLECWLVDHGIYVGVGEVVAGVIMPNKPQEGYPGGLRESGLARGEGDKEGEQGREGRSGREGGLVPAFLERYPGLAIVDPGEIPGVEREEVELVLQLRRQELENDVRYYTNLVNHLGKDESLTEVIYLSPSLSKLEILRLLLLEWELVWGHELVVFGDYKWNTLELNWSEPGAWMSYEQRVGRGERLGRATRPEENGDEVVSGWMGMVSFSEGLLSRCPDEKIATLTADDLKHPSHDAERKA